MSRELKRIKCAGYTDTKGVYHKCDDMVLRTHSRVRRCILCQKMQDKTNRHNSWSNYWERKQQIKRDKLSNL